MVPVGNKVVHSMAVGMVVEVRNKRAHVVAHKAPNLAVAQNDHLAGPQDIQDMPVNQGSHCQLDH